MAKLIHLELSYQVRGVLLDVYNTLGPLLKESYYRDAIGIGLQKRGFVCEVEKGFEDSGFPADYFNQLVYHVLYSLCGSLINSYRPFSTAL